METGGSNMLSNFTKYDTTRLRPYENFLLECKQRDITIYAKHKHHILPVFMGGGNEPDNFIELTPEDHYNAHLILAECFDKGTDECRYNLSAGNCIMRNAKRTLKKVYGVNIPVDLVEFWKRVNFTMKDVLRGENNPMYGKTHSNEVKEKISDKVQKAYSNGFVPYRKGKKFEPLTLERKEAISKFHKGKVLSQETKDKMSKAKTKPKILNKGVFSESPESFYRVCSCGKFLFYKKLYYANCAERDCVRCKSCCRKGKPTSLKGKKTGKRTYKVIQHNRDMKGCKNPNSKSMIVVETGEFFSTRKELLFKFGKSGTWLDRQVKIGNIVYGNA